MRPSRVVQIVGQNGMLGRALQIVGERMGCEVISDGYDLEADEPNPELILAPVVINCGTRFNGAVPTLNKVNSLGPKVLYQSCRAANAYLIHVSCAEVFEFNGPHNEASIPTPVSNSYYAISKLRGELADQPNALTVRTSLIGFGRRGPLSELITSSQAGHQVAASPNEYGTWHTVDAVAKVLAHLASRPATRRLHGILHIPGAPLSKFELMQSLSEQVLGRPWIETVVKDETAQASSYDRRLVSTRWEGLPELPSLRQQLIDMEWRTW